MSERLAALPTAKHERLREALEELARRHHLGSLTVREAAQKLRLRQTEILELVEASERLDLITAYRVGGGLGQITRQGDYQLQYEPA